MYDPKLGFNFLGHHVVADEVLSADVLSSSSLP